MPGMGGGDNPMGLSEQQMQEQKMVKMMQAGMESCAAKTMLSGAAGFALGGMFGIFMTSMRYDTPLSSPLNATNPLNPANTPDITALPLRQQLRLGARDMAKTAYSSAKNFGFIGAVFAGTECCIEGFRAKNDIWNGVSAGCLTGGGLALKAGPQAVALGCGGFAAFSAAIDWYLRLPEDEKRKNVI